MEHKPSRMLRTTSLLVLLVLSACAGTQSSTAFTPRSAPPEEPVAVTADRTAQHEQALADSLERSLERQEKEDQAEQTPAEPTHEGVPARPPRTDPIATAR